MRISDWSSDVCSSDLHSCLYLGETAGDNRWHLRRGELQETVTVRGRYISNHSEARLLVALAGLGITCLPHFTAAQALADGQLREVLPQWRYTGSYQGAAWLLLRQNHPLPPKPDRTRDGKGKRGS